MTIDVQSGLELHLTLGRLAERLDKDADERRRLREIARARVPSIIRLQGSAIVPTPTAPIGINLGGPDTGYEWVVRRIITGGLTWSTTAAGTAEVYVTGLGSLWGTSSGTLGTAAGVRALSDLVDQSAALPNKAFYGRDELVVKESEALVIVINGGTAAQQYVATAGLQVVRTSAALWGAAQGL